MSIYDKPDNQIDGQMTIEDLYNSPEQLFAVSRVFARARKEMNLIEQKTFVYALTQIKFTEEARSNVIQLDKKRLAEILGIECDADHLSVNLYRLIKEIPKHSYIEIDRKDIGIESSGCVVSEVRRYRNVIELEFYAKYMRLFSGLSSGYITMWGADVFQMQSKNSVNFYEYLRQATNTEQREQQVIIGIRKFKELFGIPEKGKGSYTRKDGHFDRPAFEKRVIQPLCDDMKNCVMIKLIVQPDGKSYEKVKSGSRVIGYRFYWTFSAYPAVASADEVHELQERVDQNPVVLKVAKDIVKGGKKQKAKKETNDFNERVYDFADLERKLMERNK